MVAVMGEVPTARAPTEVAPGDGHGSESWRSLYRAAGWAALISALLIPVLLVVYVTNPFPDTVAGWFRFLHDRPLAGLVDLDLFLLIDNVLLVAIALAVYVALRRANPSVMLIGTALWFVSIVMFVVVNPAFQMLSLSDKYAAATGAQRLAALAAGQAVLANWEGSAFHVGYIAGSLAGILVGWVMLKSGVFGKAVAYVMIGANVLGFGLYIPEVGTAISAFSGLLIGVWYVLMTRGFWRLTRLETLTR